MLRPPPRLLTSVTDLDDSVYHFTYTPRGEIATRQFATGFVERYGYDADGRIMADTVLNPNDANYSVCPPDRAQSVTNGSQEPSAIIPKSAGLDDSPEALGFALRRRP
jgi:YD repeat-containing protein